MSPWRCLARRRVLRSVLPVLCAVALSQVACRREQEGPTTKPTARPTNLILVTLDTTRADRIGCYGYAPAQTPTFDSIAHRGVLFSNAVSPVPMTLPAHATIMTGLYPREHGVRVNGQNSVPEGLVTLATLFRDRGVRTGAFVASFVLNKAFGLNRGFDIFDDEIDKTGDDQSNLAAERPANEVTDRALAWLAADEGKPFFCWIHYYDAHDPYSPPPPYNFTVGHPYDGELAFMDAQFKRVTDWLDAKRLRDSTSIIVVGDHGEAFGEHLENGHVMFLYQANVHVPLLIDHPGIGIPGATVDALVGLTDVAPTIAEASATDEAYFRWNSRLLRNCGLINFLDGCAATVPCHAPGDAPVGMMVCGTAMRDRHILAVASAIEDALARFR